MMQTAKLGEAFFGHRALPVLRGGVAVEDSATEWAALAGVASLVMGVGTGVRRHKLVL